MKNREKEKKLKTVWVCDFCGREFSTKNNSDKHELRCFKNPENKKFPYTRSPKKAWIYFWVTTILVFAVTCFFGANLSSQGLNLYQKELFTYLLLGNIGLGIIAFLGIAFSYRRPKNKTIPHLVKYILPVCLIYFLINSAIFAIESETLRLETQTNKNQSTLNLPPTITPKPSAPPGTPTKTPAKYDSSSNNNSGQIDCVGPDGVHFQTTQQKCDDFNRAWGIVPTLNPNEYIRCNISPNCGGGYKEMTRSACDNMTCCQINNTWELRDKGQCNSEQEKEINDEWIDFCNGLYNPDNCSTYWDSGTSNWFDCRTDAYNGRLDCYNRNH